MEIVLVYVHQYLIKLRKAQVAEHAPLEASNLLDGNTVAAFHEPLFPVLFLSTLHGFVDQTAKHEVAVPIVV